VCSVCVCVFAVHVHVVCVLGLCDNHDKSINLLSIIMIKQYFIIVIIVNLQILL